MAVMVTGDLGEGQQAINAALDSQTVEAQSPVRPYGTAALRNPFDCIPFLVYFSKCSFSVRLYIYPSQYIGGVKEDECKHVVR
jgi:hypothetical protein